MSKASDLNYVMMFTEENLKCEFVKDPEIPLFFTAVEPFGKGEQKPLDICVYSPESETVLEDEEAEEGEAFFNCKIHASVCQRLKEYATSLVIVRHGGGLVSMFRSDQLFKIADDKCFMYDYEREEDFLDINCYPSHVGITGTNQALAVTITCLG